MRIRYVIAVAGALASAFLASCDDRVVTRDGEPVAVSTTPAVPQMELPVTECGVQLEAGNGNNVVLPPGNCIRSANGTYALYMTFFGNAELRKFAPGVEPEVIWKSNDRQPSTVARVFAVQTDGNLVVYEGETPIWNSATSSDFATFSFSVEDTGTAILNRVAADGAMTQVWKAP